MSLATTQSSQHQTGFLLLMQLEAHRDLRPAVLWRDDLRACGHLGDQRQPESQPRAVEPRHETVTVIADSHPQRLAIVLGFHLDRLRASAISVGVHNAVGHRLRDAQRDRVQRPNRRPRSRCELADRLSGVSRSLCSGVERPTRCGHYADNIAGGKPPQSVRRKWRQQTSSADPQHQPSDGVARLHWA